jgi:hypothetical protein
MDVLRMSIGLAGAALGLLFWFRLVRAEPRFRAWVAERFDVTISTSMRGHWKVRGSGSWWGDLGIELLQLGYFMGGFVVWSIGLLMLVGLMAWLG